MSNNYSDAQMLLATQIAYLNIGEGQTVGDYIQQMQSQYGINENGSFKGVDENAPDYIKRQFEALERFQEVAENNNLSGWENWKVVDACDDNTRSGMYGCLIDTGDGSAIIGFRGSESMEDVSQFAKDWIVADMGLLGNEETLQQHMAEKYTKHVWENYGKWYRNFSLTGHSLGGNLAEHAVITAPDEMRGKIDRSINYDGPGFSDEYLKSHIKDISAVSGKLAHYHWSIVGSLLFPVPGSDEKVIAAHDDMGQENELAQKLWRHSPVNVELKDGSVVETRIREFEDKVGLFSRKLELGETALHCFFPKSKVTKIFDVLEQINHAEIIADKMEDMISDFKKRLNTGIKNLVYSQISGEYEVNLSSLSRIEEKLQSVERRIRSIADNAESINKNLPYFSASAAYYKAKIKGITWGIDYMGNRVEKTAGTVTFAMQNYKGADNYVASLF